MHTTGTTDHETRYPSLAGRTVFISGGATGIGATLVEQFVRQGARVGFVDVDAASAQALVERLGAGERLVFEQADVTDIGALRAAIQSIRARIGPIAVLLNNAANDRRHQLMDTTPESWDQGVAVNLKHQYFAAREVAADMQALGGGSIVNFGSVSWMRKQAGLSVYATCKSAVQGLTRSLARELGPHRIRVNTLVPGWVMTDKQVTLWLTEQSKADLLREQCLPDLLMPSHIARAALFLASDDSAMMTAQDLVVDAGWT